MSAREFGPGLLAAFRGVRPVRALVLLLLALATALASDWWRDERVIFPAPLPQFTTVPKAP